MSPSVSLIQNSVDLTNVWLNNILKSSPTLKDYILDILSIPDHTPETITLKVKLCIKAAMQTTTLMDSQDLNKWLHHIASNHASTLNGLLHEVINEDTVQQARRWKLWFVFADHWSDDVNHQWLHQMKTQGPIVKQSNCKTISAWTRWKAIQPNVDIDFYKQGVYWLLKDAYIDRNNSKESNTLGTLFLDIFHEYMALDPDLHILGQAFESFHKTNKGLFMNLPWDELAATYPVIQPLLEPFAVRSALISPAPQNILNKVPSENVIEHYKNINPMKHDVRSYASILKHVYLQQLDVSSIDIPWNTKKTMMDALLQNGRTADAQEILGWMKTIKKTDWDILQTQNTTNMEMSVLHQKVMNIIPYVKELPALMENVPFWRTVANLIYNKKAKLNVLEDNFGLPPLYVQAIKAHGDDDFANQHITKWLLIPEFTSEDLAWDVLMTHFQLKHIENPSVMIQLRKSLDLDFNDFIILQTKSSPLIEFEHDNAFTNFHSNT